MTMSDTLRDLCIAHGWRNPECLLWGEVMDGSPGHLTLKQPDGVVKTYYSPLACIEDRKAKQAAIVRFH